MAIFIVYDITDKVTWERAKEWMNYVRDEAKGYNKVLVIGNKKDLEMDQREVSYEDANTECMTYGFNHIEVSAKSKYNIETLQRWLDSHTENKVDNEIKENKDKEDGNVRLKSEVLPDDLRKILSDKEQPKDEPCCSYDSILY